MVFPGSNSEACPLAELTLQRLWAGLFRYEPRWNTHHQFLAICVCLFLAFCVYVKIDGVHGGYEEKYAYCFRNCKLKILPFLCRDLKCSVVLESLWTSP